MQKRSSTAFELSKVSEALNKVLLDARCPISGHKTWTVAPEFVDINPVAIYLNAPLRPGSETPNVNMGYGLGNQENRYPAVMAICNGCGFVALFNAVKLGLLPPLEQP